MNPIIDFLLRTWMYLLAATAGIVGYYLATHWRTLADKKKVAGLFVIALACHMLEERVYPGGYHYIFNTVMAAGMNQLGVMVCNVLVVVAMVWVFTRLSHHGWAVLLVAILGLAELALHTYLGIRSYQLFAATGQVLPYSPGLATSVFLFLPISIWAIRVLIKDGDLSTSNPRRTLTTIALALAGVIVVGPGLILLPQIIFSDPTGSYAFPDNGYYSQFLSH